MCERPPSRGWPFYFSFGRTTDRSAAITIHPQMPEQSFIATSADTGRRLDQFLTSALGAGSRARVQQLIEQDKVTVNGLLAKSSLKLEGNETIAVTGELQLPPL